MVIASGRKHLLRAGRLTDLPVARGLVRLGEAFAVLPAVRRGLPQARFAMEDRRAALGGARRGDASPRLARRRLRSVLAQEAVGAVAGLAPALLTLRGSQAAVWHAVEHKSIAAYEAGGADEVANAAAHAKEHDRCGSNLDPAAAGHDDDRQHRRAEDSSGGARIGGRTVVAALSVGSGGRGLLLLRAPPGAPGLARHPRRGPRHAVGLRHARAEPGRPARRPAPRWRRCCAPRRPDAARLTAGRDERLGDRGRAGDRARWPGSAGPTSPAGRSGTPTCIGAARSTGPLAPGTRLELHLRHPRGPRVLHAAAPDRRRAGAGDLEWEARASACARRPAPR